jgi:hypothetical protein
LRSGAAVHRFSGRTLRESARRRSKTISPGTFGNPRQSARLCLVPTRNDPRSRVLHPCYRAARRFSAFDGQRATFEGTAIFGPKQTSAFADCPRRAKSGPREVL